MKTESALISQVSLPASGTFPFGVQKRESRTCLSKGSRDAVSSGICGVTPYSFRALRPLCSCRFFGCRRCCLWPPAFSCFPELCCPWLQEAPRPSPRPPRAPAMFPARSLQPLSPAPTRRSPRRSPGGDLSVERGRRIMTAESWGWERRVHSRSFLPVEPWLWAASAKLRVMGPS